MPTVNRAATITYWLFSLFIIVSLITPSWRYGPFSWWPVWRFETLAGAPMHVGILNFLPVLVIIVWVVQQLQVARWRWGPRSISIPLLLFSIWAAIRVLDATPRLQFIYLGDLFLVWLVYLFLVNLAPRLRPILAIVVVIQGIVGCLQFALQRDLGLVLFGELPLNPAFAGVTVLQARGEPWLRAYGLTAHPNLYGALLALSLLLIVTRNREGWRAQAFAIFPVLALGLAGLFFSFSRTAWLGAAAALVVWLVIRRRAGEGNGRLRLRWLIPPLLLVALALLVYGDLVLSRIANLQEPIEAKSISQRLYDGRLALQLFSDNLWSGVGLGRNVNAALRFAPDAQRVHNVLLLAAAELGIPGLLSVLALLVAPLWALLRLYHQGEYARCAAGLAPWVLVIIVNQLDTTLWLTGNWQTAMLFGLAAGNAAQSLQEAPIRSPLAREPVVVARSEESLPTLPLSQAERGE